MSILITIVLVVVGIVALLLIAALFTKKEYSITRSVTIAKPREEVFNYIRYLKNQEAYSKWVMTDPDKKIDTKGSDGSVGFVYAWDGNKQAGKGEQEIMSIIPNERMDVEVRFIKPFEGVASTPMVTESVGSDQTKVTWGMVSSMKYPMNIMLVLLNLERGLAKDLEISLSNLKRILER